MKFSLVALAATVAVASAAECDVTKFTPLLTDPSLTACTAESGFSVTDLSKLTAETMPKLCASTACKTVLTAIKGLGLGDCTLMGMKLETELLTPISTACASASATTGGSTAGSSNGSSTGGATVGSSTSDSKTSTGGSSGGASANTVDTPAANSTTTTPAPTTTSSAPSVAIAASAAVVAVRSVAAAAITFVIATRAATAGDCDIRALKPLLKDTNVINCGDDLGFSLIPSSSPPGKLPAERTRKMCASKACAEMLVTLKGLGLGDCALLGVKLETDLLNPVQTACGNESSAAIVTASSGSDSTSTTGSRAAETAASVESSSAVTTKPPPVEGDSLDNVADGKPPVVSKTPAPAPTSATSFVIAIYRSNVAAAVVIGMAIVQLFL